MFKEYPKIYRIGVEENDGILNGECFVQEKIDGANTSIWLDGVIRTGSRTQEVTEKDFQGFNEYVKGNKSISSLLEDHPTYRLFGEWLCLSGDTIIKKVSGGRGSKGNYMTLRDMYNYLHSPDKDRVKSWWERYGMPSIYSLDINKDRVLPNRIKTIVYTGNKDVFEIKTREGFFIKSTKEHKFLTQCGWVELGSLDKNIHVLAVSDLRAERKNIRNLGVGSRKIIKEQKEFVKKIGVCKMCPSKNSLELDHIDENWENNNKNNWQVLCSECHRKKSGSSDSKTRPHKSGYSYRFDKIVSIKKVGIEDVYDIGMEGSENVANFVANNFVVHNCRHTIQYKETSYKQWYMFDILDRDTWLTTGEVDKIAREYEIKTPEIFGVFENPTLEIIMGFVGKTFLGERGEGVVIKNPKFLNKFGDRVYAKIVTQSFKEDNSLVFGGNNKHSDTYHEMYVVQKYVTMERVRKIMNKIDPTLPEGERFDMRHIPRIMESVYHDVLTEHIYEIAKKVPALDFKQLKRLAGAKAKKIYVDILNDFISIAYHK